jgi:hypothetical protein
LHALGKEAAKRARSAQISGAILPSYYFQFTIGISWAIGDEVATKININTTFHEYFTSTGMRIAVIKATKILITQYEDAVASWT